MSWDIEMEMKSLKKWKASGRGQTMMNGVTGPYKRGHDLMFLEGFREAKAIYENDWHYPNKDALFKLPENSDKLYLVYEYCTNSNHSKFGEYIPVVCSWDNNFQHWNNLTDTNHTISPVNVLKWTEV